MKLVGSDKAIEQLSQKQKLEKDESQQKQTELNTRYRYNQKAL
jgi:hypothetical protein